LSTMAMASIVGTVNDFLVPVVDGFFVEPAFGDIDFEDGMGQPWQAGQHRSASKASS
jgi:hypothetical protein